MACPSVFGLISVVPAEEFNLLLPLSLSELVEQTAMVRSDLTEVEKWLGSPPADATPQQIQEKLVSWDTCGQWLCAYEARLARAERAAPSDLRGGAAGGASSAPVRDFSVLLEQRPRTLSVLGAACDICDGHFGCNCIKEKVAAQMAAEKRKAAALIRQGKCACHLLPEEAQDYGEFCDLCEKAMCPDCERVGCSGHCQGSPGPECDGCGRTGDCWCCEEAEDSEDEHDRRERLYKQWKADQHKYGP